MIGRRAGWSGAQRVFRVFALAGVAGFATGSLACTDLGSGSGGVLAVAVSAPPFPGVVVLDTLRDSLGAVVRLKATAFGPGGINDTVRNATVRFVPLDTSVRIDSLGYLFAISKDTTKHGKQSARYVADVNGIQTPIQTISITLRPDAVVRRTLTSVQLNYVPDATADTSNRSVSLEVRVRHVRSALELFSTVIDTVVPAYLVRFEIAYAGPAVADSVRLVDDNAKITHVDTTDDSGIAGRRVKIFPRSNASATDSVIVRARVFYRNAEITGSPVSLPVVLKKAP